MKNFLTKIGVIGLVLGIFISCSSAPKYHNFPDNPALRERFVGTWRSESRIGGNYGLTVFNADGTFSETSFNSSHRVTSTYAGLYKVSANQFMMQVITPRREALWSYNFLDDNTFSISGGGSNLLGRNNANFLYRRID
jgi:hypothetical protein